MKTPPPQTSPSHPSGLSRGDFAAVTCAVGTCGVVLALPFALPRVWAQQAATSLDQSLSFTAVSIGVLACIFLPLWAKNRCRAACVSAATLLAISFAGLIEGAAAGRIARVAGLWLGLSLAIATFWAVAARVVSLRPLAWTGAILLAVGLPWAAWLSLESGVDQESHSTFYHFPLHLLMRLLG